MDVLVGREFGKSLPAELRGFSDGAGRLAATGHALESGYGSPNRLAGIGDLDAQDIADLIQSSSQATLPLIVANNPGTMLQVGPNGQMTVYHQPTGTTANLNVGTTAYLPAGTYGAAGAGGVINTPLGSASFGGLSGNSLMMIAVAAAVALVVLKGK